jgi:hypothetical protein
MAPPKSNPSQRQLLCTAKVAQTMRYYDAVEMMRRTPFFIAEKKQVATGSVLFGLNRAT